MYSFCTKIQTFEIFVKFLQYDLKVLSFHISPFLAIRQKKIAQFNKGLQIQFDFLYMEYGTVNFRVNADYATVCCRMNLL